MNNEPVAEKTSNNGWMVSKEYMDLPVGTLLYTHPAKTLTDEEILQEAWYILATQWQRKAQEK